MTATREPGWYWVRDRFSRLPEADWRAVEWNGTGWIRWPHDSFPAHVVSDSSMAEIDERRIELEPPFKVREGWYCGGHPMNLVAVAVMLEANELSGADICREAAEENESAHRELRRLNDEIIKLQRALDSKKSG